MNLHLLIIIFLLNFFIISCFVYGVPKLQMESQIFKTLQAQSMFTRGTELTTSLGKDVKFAKKKKKKKKKPDMVNICAKT